MRTTVIRRWMLASLALLTAASVAGCGSSGAPGGAGPSIRQTTPSATPTGSGGVRNLAISSAERGNLTAAFVAHKGISPADVFGAGPLPGSVYYAYDPAAGTYWALAEFHPSSTASLSVKVNFQDGGNYGMFRKAGTGPWQVQTPGWPPVCAEAQFFPSKVLTTWGLPTSPPAGESGC